MRHLAQVRTRVYPGDNSLLAISILLLLPCVCVHNVCSTPHTVGSPGCVENMKSIRKIWQPIVEKRRRIDPASCRYIMVELLEDESGIMPKIEYWREKDSILGSCGFCSDIHKCNDHFHPVIGDSWDNLVNIMSKAIPSPYVRVIMVNPLVDWLPAMTLLVNATCNKFDHVPHVSDQWKSTLKAFNDELKPLGCNYCGRGSDGDGRRYKLQHEMFTQAMTQLVTLRRATLLIQTRWRQRCTNSLPLIVLKVIRTRIRNKTPACTTSFTLPISLEGAKGFTFAATASYSSKGGSSVMTGITGLSTQDPKHKGKRLDMPLQSAAKTMLVGNYVASAIDLFLVRQYLQHEQVRNLRTSDLRWDDRQNFAAVVRRSGKLVIGILELLQQGTPTRSPHKTQGTVAVYKLISKYLLIFFSVKLTLADRVQLAGYVTHFLRLWHVSIRCWPNQNERNVAKNFYPMQTFRQVLMSAQSAVLFIMGCRQLTPNQICGLRFLGSDCCEILFSMIGGWGGLTSWQRNFTFRGCLKKMEDSNALMSIRARGNVRQQTHRNLKAGEFENRLHEDMNLPDADLKVYPDNDVMVERWNAGVTEAKIDCEQLGMKHADVSEDIWSAPWKIDPTNPRVTGFDDYLNRKFPNNDDTAKNNTPAGNDDDCNNVRDNDTIDNDVDDDPLVVTAQLDYALDTIRDAVDNNGVETGTKKHMIQTPNGKSLSKETAICMLREAFDSNGKVSKDRLKRIVQCAQRAREDVSRLPEHDGSSLELHKDVALAFDPGQGRPFEL